ncbi:MAG: type II toxin-antitoxin system VapC family toxin [Sphingobacteriales bacterium]
MGQGYLIDSNVIIDFAALRLPQEGSDFVEELFNNNFLISVVVKIEVLGFDNVPDKLLAMEEFLNTAVLLPLDEVVTKQAILLRRRYKKLKLGDAIIAATAIVHNLILISRNTKDFINIKGLQVLDPHKL